MPSASIRIGNAGSGRTAGPLIGRAPSRTSNSDWWQGQIRTCWSDRYSPTGQPACVQIFENARNSSAPMTSPGAGLGRGAAEAVGASPIRISNVAALGSVVSPSGKTVRTPPTGRSLATTGDPPSIARRRPARQLVVNRLRPGAGPNEKTGIASAAASAASAPPSPTTSSRRLLKPASSVSVSSSSAMAAGSRPTGSRGSIWMRVAISRWPQITMPAPSAPNAANSSSPSTCV